MVSEMETDGFVTNERNNTNSRRTQCYSIWWHQGHRLQREISRIVESNYFRVLVIFLVVVDTGLVIAEIMLDSLKGDYECEIRVNQSSIEDNEWFLHRIELTIEVVHYGSIAILIFFVFELLVRIYASGKEFWNIQRKKMEYFDAFIVITSLAIDIVLIHGEKRIVGHHLLLILTFRLWRFVRIVSSVGEGILQNQTKHKARLNREYLSAIRLLVEVITHKTHHIEKNNNDNEQNLQAVLEHFHRIDDQCRSAEEKLERNRSLPSSAIVSQFLRELQELENKDNDSVAFEKSFKAKKDSLM